MKELKNGWQEHPTQNYHWNKVDFRLDVEETEACYAYITCLCGEYVELKTIGVPGATCVKCKRMYQVEIARRLNVYTPLAIRYPKKQEVQA